MPLNGIFPDWMLPTIESGGTTSVAQADIVLETTELVVAVFATPTDIALPDVVQICILESAPTVTIETTPAVLSLSPQNEIIVERCTD